MPYVDAWDVKGPAAALPFLLTTSLFGSASWSIRPFDVVLVLATAFAVYRTVLPWSGRAAAWLGVALWILSYGALGFNNTAQPDGWVAMGVLLAAAPALRRDREPGLTSAILLATVCGIATMVKPFYLLYLLPAGMMAWRAPAPSRPVRLGITLVAAIVPVALIALWLAWGGALDAARDGFLGFNLAKNSGGLIPLVLFNLSYGLLREPSALLLGVLAAAGFGRLIARRPPAEAEARQQLLLLAVLIAIGVATSLIQRPWYPSRVLPVLPPLALAAALGLGELFEPDQARVPAFRAVLGATLALALLVVVREPLADTVRAARVAVGLRSLQSYEQLYNFHGATAADVRAMARTLAERTAPGDAGFAWRHLGVMLLAERPAASRLMLPVTLWDDAPEPWRSAFAAEIDSVLTSGPAWLLLEAPSAKDTLMPELEPLRFLPGTAAQLEGRYQLAAVEGPLRLFLRR
ncbi:MAG TPA: hypothetical protein VFS94_12905 [Gemmatimonadales bacterium]|nr:hypothetical protein [Gemmatimonadales bacterium]